MSWWGDLMKRFIGETQSEESGNSIEEGSSDIATTTESPLLSNVLVIDSSSTATLETSSEKQQQNQSRKSNGRIFELAVIEDRFVVSPVLSSTTERIFIVEDNGELTFWAKPVNPYGFRCTSVDDVVDSMFIGRIIKWSQNRPLPQLLDKQRGLVRPIHIPHSQRSREERVDDKLCLAVCAILEYILMASHRDGNLLQIIVNGASAHEYHDASHETSRPTARFVSDQSRLEAALPNMASKAALSNAFSAVGGGSVTRRIGASTTDELVQVNVMKLDDDAEAKNRSTKRDIKRKKARKDMKKHLRDKDRRAKESNSVIANLPEAKKRQAILNMWNAQGGIKAGMSLVGNTSVAFVNNKVQRRLDQHRIMKGQRPSTASSSSSSSSGEDDASSSSSASSSDFDEDDDDSDGDSDGAHISSGTTPHDQRADSHETSDSEDRSAQSDSSVISRSRTKKKRWRYAPGSANWTQRLFANLVNHWVKLFSLDQTTTKMLTQWLECECEGWYKIDATLAVLMVDQTSLTNCEFGSPHCQDSRRLRRELESRSKSPDLPQIMSIITPSSSGTLSDHLPSESSIVELPSFETFDIVDGGVTADQIETPEIFNTDFPDTLQ